MRIVRSLREKLFSTFFAFPLASVSVRVLDLPGTTI